jgi:hypothetical protein
MYLGVNAVQIYVCKCVCVCVCVCLRVYFDDVWTFRHYGMTKAKLIPTTSFLHGTVKLSSLLGTVKVLSSVDSVYKVFQS